MLIQFLNSLYKKPKEYQLFWVYILGQINEEKPIVIRTKKLKKIFPHQSSTFYRILGFGLDYFNSDSSDVFMEMKNKCLHISVNKSNKGDAQKVDNVSKVFAENIIDYLNEKTNKKYTLRNKQTLRLVNARIKEGYSLEDFKKVIDIKSAKWANTEMEDYLRPQTLFSQKMEGYLNEKLHIKNGNERFAKTQSAVDEAKQFDWFGKK